MGRDNGSRSTVRERAHRLALLLSLATVAFAGLPAAGAQAATFEFPSSSSTVVASGGAPAGTIGYFWSQERGDMVEEAFSGPAAIDHATLSVQPAANSLSPERQLDWTLSINGTDIGAFAVPSGSTAPIVLPLSFAPIAGPNYAVKLRVANEVAGGDGSISLASTGSSDLHSLELSNEAPDTHLSDGPPPVTTGTSATFAFSSSQLDVAGFQCSIDHTNFVPCASPRTYDALSAGAHSFEVSAIDTFGNVDASPATWLWTIARAAANGPGNADVAPVAKKKHKAKSRKCKKGFRKAKRHGKRTCVRKKHRKRKHRH